MEIEYFYSSSNGNLYTVYDGKTRIMLEAGVKMRQITDNVKLKEVSACLVSHNHKDHAESAQKILNLGIPLYTSKGTAEASELASPLLKIIKGYEMFSVGTFNIIPFPTVHDCPEPLGFFLQSTANDETVLFATDTAYIIPRFEAVNYLMIECNYSEKLLAKAIAKKKTVLSLANRVRSSHFEIEAVCDFVRANDLKQLKHVYLLHLSSGHGDANEFATKIRKIAGVPVTVCV